MSTLARQLNEQTVSLGMEARAELEAHAAWHGALSQAEAEALLKGKAPFTYLIRDGGAAGIYFVSFVKEDLSFENDWITFEKGMGVWCYRNIVIVKSRRELHEIIPLVLHAEADRCTPLSR